MWQALTTGQLKVSMLKLRKFPPICGLHGSRGYTSVSNQYAGPIVISGISGRFPKAAREKLTGDTKCRWSSEKLPKSLEIHPPFKLHEDALVCLKTHPSDRKAFIVYGTDGGCNNFTPLASRLKANVYGFQFTGKDGWNSVPELADLYVKEITEREPNGPYTIMGFSAGAPIAFEIAHKLQNLDETVQNLVFLDGCPSLKQTLNRRFAFDLLRALNILRKLPQDLITSFETSLTGNVAQDILEVFKVLNRSTGWELTTEETDAYAFLNEKLAEHAPREVYNEDVTLIQATDPSIAIFASSDDYNVSKFCTGQVRVHKVVGNHLTFLREENVNETADILNGLLY